jgi:hypothetical protein
MTTALFVAALAVAVTGMADRPPELTATGQADYKTWLSQRAVESEAFLSLQSACAAAVVSDAPGGKTVVSKGPDGATLAVEPLEIKGCGRDVHVTMEVHIDTAGARLARSRLPGDSLADFPLQQEAIKLTTQVVQSDQLPAGCTLQFGKTLAVGPTTVMLKPGMTRFYYEGEQPPKDMKPGMMAMKVADKYHGVAEEKVWHEVWPIKACGENRTVEIIFLPMKEGGINFLIGPQWKLASAPTPAAH